MPQTDSPGFKFRTTHPKADVQSTAYVLQLTFYIIIFLRIRGIAVVFPVYEINKMFMLVEWLIM